jgi:hypothetical protein
MGPAARGIAALALALAAAACSRPPNPVVAHDPIPPPSPAYAARCYSSPTIFHGYAGACRPILRPVEERVIVRASG